MIKTATSDQATISQGHLMDGSPIMTHYTGKFPNVSCCGVNRFIENVPECFSNALLESGPEAIFLLTDLAHKLPEGKMRDEVVAFLDKVEELDSQFHDIGATIRYTSYNVK